METPEGPRGRTRARRPGIVATASSAGPPAALGQQDGRMASTGDVPILLLDVDGVLNTARADPPDGWA